MIKLNAVKAEKVWGYELWIASTHPNGPQKDFVDAVKDYPLLVKIIQADDTLSVQVHPDDKTAVSLEGNDARGKTECWYVLDAKDDAKLVYGLNNVYTKEELSQSIESKTLENCLNYVNVKKGDFIYIPSGTVHAIGGGLRLLEVQQSCDITYRLYDWGRPRELHIQKGLDSIKNEKPLTVKPFDESFSCEYFDIQQVNINGGWSMMSFDHHRQALDWTLVYVVEGSGYLHNTPKGEKAQSEIKFKAEDIFAIAPGEKLTMEGKAKVMKITIPQE